MRNLFTVIAVVALAGLALLGCGGDDNPTDPVPVRPASRNTPDSLLTSWLERAFADKDSAAYAAALDPAFTFEFLSDVSDTLCQIAPELCTAFAFGSTATWDRSAELESAYQMFGAPTVGRVSLDVSPQSEVDYTGSDCVGCREINATIAFEVVIGPTLSDPLTVTVDSPQFFLVKPDPTDASKWVLFRQVDQPAPGTARAGGNAGSAAGSLPAPARPSSIEVSSWSRVKAFFAGYLSSPVGDGAP